MIEILDNHTIHKMNVNDVLSHCPVLDGVHITMNGNKPQIFLPENMLGDRYKKWKFGRGQIFLNDIKKGGEFYYLIKLGDENIFIIRLIEEEELEKFKNKNLISGKIKDSHFMILKDFNIKYSNSNNFDEYIEEEYLSTNTPNIPLEEESDNSTHSISLFEE